MLDDRVTVELKTTHEHNEDADVHHCAAGSVSGKYRETEHLCSR